MTVVGPADVLVRLRRETRRAHDRLEAELNLLDPELTVTRYAHLLERFLGFHRVLEPRLDAWHAREPTLDWPERRKVHLLEADLAVLTACGSRAERSGLCPEVPSIRTTADALGALYVVEGATLGGRLIAASLAGGEVPSTALRFFSSYGDGVGRRWKVWRTTTSEWVGDDRVRSDAVVVAAVLTFEVLERWLAPAMVRDAA